MNRNQLWIQLQIKLVKIFNFRRVLFSLIFGSVLSWIMKDELTSVLFGGKTFTGRSTLVQIAILVFFVLVFAVLLIYIFYFIRSSLNQHLDIFLVSFSDFVEQILGLSTVYWFLASFSIAYFLFFISPVFLNSEQSMKFTQYIPIVTPIGFDLRQILNFGMMFIKNESFNFGNVYPPLFTLFIIPFASINPASVYKVLTIINALSYLSVTFIIPALITKTKQALSLIIAIFFTGLFSYGFHFEMERGQFNLIAFQFALVAVYLFHYKPRFRYIAYLLFSIGAQFKVYPAIFIFMFVDDWKDWKANIKRLAGIGIANLVLLFILGYRPMINFLDAIRNIRFPYVWIGNHSIKSFVTLLQGRTFEEVFISLQMFTIHEWLIKYAPFIGIILMIFVALCFLAVLIISIKQNEKGFNSNLFLISTLVALLVPAISHDYTLSILASAMGIALGVSVNARISSRFRLLSLFLISLTIFAYSSTLFSYTNKPLLLQNNLPALMIILLCFTVLALLPKPKIDSF